MRASLVMALTDYMKSIDADQSQWLASKLTNLVNLHIAGNASGESKENLEELSLQRFPKEAWNELTVGVPWEAHSYAHGAYAKQHKSSSIMALFSAPAYFDVTLSEATFHSGLWGGSLLVALGKILEGVRRDLIVLSPYWSSLGVRSLLAAAGRQSYEGVMITVLTQAKANMKPVDIEGLDYFTEILKANGAQVCVLSPKSIDGITPFLHAKLIIADGTKAYVGSANFTRSGLDYGLEAGVLIEGDTANDFAIWTKAVSRLCVPW